MNVSFGSERAFSDAAQASTSELHAPLLGRTLSVCKATGYRTASIVSQGHNITRLTAS